MSAIGKYLLHYAEAEVTALDSLPDGHVWENVMVIPACNETPGFLRAPPACHGCSLMILVINESEDATTGVSSSNLHLANAVEQRFELLWQFEYEGAGYGLKLFQDPGDRRDILLVDRFNKGRKLPVKGGVGQARKIGVDLAVALFNQKRLQGPWIHCTDADVQLPGTYFTSSDSVNNRDGRYAALVFPFHHFNASNELVNKEILLATQLYELSLRYYVAAMTVAGSPYAFHTIGSTMAVSVEHYVKVRGFPKRQAGEDFYLLNKLAKVGDVLQLQESEQCQPVMIEPRRSDRVPFGTGAAVNKMLALSELVSDFRFYAPEVFKYLRYWLQRLPIFWHTGATDLEILIADQPKTASCIDEALLIAGLEKIKTGQAINHALRHSKSLEQFERHMHTWFDAFRTLKLIHYLRDTSLPGIAYASLQEAPFFVELLRNDPMLFACQRELQRQLSKSQLIQ